LGYLIGIVTFFAGFALALFNARRFAVQDLMASSAAISTREKTTAEAVVISSFGTLLIGLCVFYVYYILFIMPSSYDKKRVEEANAQINRIAFLQMQHKELFDSYTSDIVRLGLISGDPVQFQRDIQRNLRRRGFSVGIDKNGFSIKAIAKDTEDTEVSVSIGGN
jgi:phosphoglycerol transferase MdoB-like AlkP superfamily enzyme